MVGYSSKMPEAMLIEAVDGKVCLTFSGAVVMVLSVSDIEITQEVLGLPKVVAQFHGSKA